MNKFKTVNVYRNGTFYKRINPNMTPWQVFKVRVKNFFKSLLYLIVFIAFCISIYKIGGAFNSEVVYKEVQKVEAESTPPVLERIAKCESGSSQYDKNGQVQLNPNTDGSVDIGIMQINNKVWSKKATELGYNLMVESDNKKMAVWIYENIGTGPWSSSSHCWNR